MMILEALGWSDRALKITIVNILKDHYLILVGETH